MPIGTLRSRPKRALGALLGVVLVGACAQPAPRPDPAAAVDARVAAIASGNEKRCSARKTIGSRVASTVCRTPGEEAVDAARADRLLREGMRDMR